MLASLQFHRWAIATFMPSFEHIDESRLERFCRKWTTSPELVSDDEFDDIQVHLLECEDCAEKARKYEEKLGEVRLLAPGEIS